MSTELNNYNLLKSLALELGINLFGTADLSAFREHINIHPPQAVEDLNTAISIGLRLSEAVLDTLIDKPTRLYFRHYKMANTLLDQAALRLASETQNMEGRSLPVPASQVLDWDKQTSHISHRSVAYHAGLGWRGRNNLLVNPLYGSQVRYATILTNIPIKIDSPIKGGCGACYKCISCCPVEALSPEGSKSYSLEKCAGLLKEFAKKERVSHICGLCVKPCKGKNELWEQ